MIQLLRHELFSLTLSYCGPGGCDRQQDMDSHDSTAGFFREILRRNRNVSTFKLHLLWNRVCSEHVGRESVARSRSSLRVLPG